MEYGDMTIAQALHQFWSGFSWTAYDQNTVPSEDLNPAMPRITYEVAWGQFEDVRTITASLWDRSYSWATVEAKAEQIADAIGGGMMLPGKTGRVYFVSATRMADEDDSIRRIIIQLEIEFYREVI